VLWKKERRGEVIGDEPGNTNEDPDTSEEAVPKGEGRAELPFLTALPQDVPGRYSGPCLRTGKVQAGRAVGTLHAANRSKRTSKLRHQDTQ
jgi:hypothetical protein